MHVTYPKTRQNGHQTIQFDVMECLAQREWAGLRIRRVHARYVRPRLHRSFLVNARSQMWQ